MAAAVHHHTSAHDELGYEDVLRLTPAPSPPPGQDMEPPYRCPVSTPANFVHPSPRVRRTKPMPISLEISLTPVSPTKRSAGGRPSRLGGHTHRSLSQQSGGGKRAPGSKGGSKLPSGKAELPPNIINSRTLDYYYVDKIEEQREEAAVNTYWLRALCAQPVHEILDKYRRRTELRRTRNIWTKTYTTPGERSLLRAWERNVPRTLPPSMRGLLASADTRSLRQMGSKAASDRGSLLRNQQRAYRSEPSAKSRPYYVEEVDSERESSEERPAASTVSGNVSISTARYSLDQRSTTMPAESPDRQLQDQAYPHHEQYQSHHDHQQQQQQHQHHQEQQQEKKRTPEIDEPGNLPPLHFAMSQSDHFRVSLPDVNKKKWTNRKGTPPVKKRELRLFPKDSKPEPVTSDSEEAQKTSRSDTPGATQPTTPRGSRTEKQNRLPSI